VSADAQYTYRYRETPLNASPELQREILLRNVSESQAMDALRARIAPTAPQLRARVLAQTEDA